MPELSSVFCLSEVGKRDHLEDAIFPPQGQALPTDHLFLVCDGVGGASKGEVASDIVASLVGEALRGQASISEADVVQALQRASSEMAGYVRACPTARDMATTLALAAVQASGILLAWCGDSRILHIRNGQVLYETTDHSLVMQLVRRGDITYAEAATHPQRNLILRSVNAREAVPEFHTLTDVQAGDYLLLCTDGVLENLDEAAIARFFTSQPAPAIGPHLYELAFGKTNDNYSLYLLELPALGPASLAPATLLPATLAPATLLPTDLQPAARPTGPVSSRAALVALAVLAAAVGGAIAGSTYQRQQAATFRPPAGQVAAARQPASRRPDTTSRPATVLSVPASQPVVLPATSSPATNSPATVLKANLPTSPAASHPRPPRGHKAHAGRAVTPATVQPATQPTTTSAPATAPPQHLPPAPATPADNVQPTPAADKEVPSTERP